MYHAHNVAILALLSLSSVIRAQEFDNNDVPSQCRTVCDSMVAAARDCDNRFDGDDVEVNCICSAPNASTQLPLCEACVRAAQNPNPGDDSDNDIYDVVTSCGFSTTTFDAAAVTSATLLPSPVTTTSGSSASTTTDDGAGGFVAATSNAGNGISSVASSVTSAAATQTAGEAAAVMTAAPMMEMGAGFGLALYVAGLL